MFALINEPAEPCARVVEDSAAGTAAVSSIAAGGDHSDRLFGGEEVSDFFAEGESLEKICEGEGLAQVDWITFDAFEVGFFVTRKERFVDGLYFAHFAEEDDSSGEHAFVFLEVRFGFYIHPNRWSCDGTLRCGRPRRGLGDKHRRVRRTHAHPSV